MLYILGYMRIKFICKLFYYNFVCNKIGLENFWDVYFCKVIVIFSLGLKMIVKVIYEIKIIIFCILWVSLLENYYKFE